MRDFYLVVYTSNYSKTPEAVVDDDPLTRHDTKVVDVARLTTYIYIYIYIYIHTHILM
jgi:hypothetical protein